MKLARWPIAAALVLVVAAFAAIKVQDLLPSSNQVRGWKVVPDTARSAYGLKALYKLYDGDVERMKKYGMKAAAEAMYRDGSAKAMIDVRQMDSAAHARALCKADIQGMKPGRAVRVTDGGGTMSIANGVTAVYLWRSSFYSTIMVFGTSASDRAAADKFVAAISSRIARATKPSKSHHHR